MAGPSTTGLMDPLALFTHGEFLCFDNDDPELLLYTHGEFPRPDIERPVGPGDPGGQGAGTGRWRREQKRWEEYERCRLEEIRKRNEAIIAATLLLLDTEDEWDDWF